MNFQGVKFEFDAMPWHHNGSSGWVFVALPADMASEIRTYFKAEEEGWGRLKATAQTGATQWKTAIWFDKKAGTYLLPLKADIRKKENIAAGAQIHLTIWI